MGCQRAREGLQRVVFPTRAGCPLSEAMSGRCTDLSAAEREGYRAAQCLVSSSDHERTYTTYLGLHGLLRDLQRLELGEDLR